MFVTLHTPQRTRAVEFHPRTVGTELPLSLARTEGDDLRARMADDTVRDFPDEVAFAAAFNLDLDAQNALALAVLAELLGSAWTPTHALQWIEGGTLHRIVVCFEGNDLAATAFTEYMTDKTPAWTVANTDGGDVWLYRGRPVPVTVEPLPPLPG